MGNSDVYIHLRTADTGTKETTKKPGETQHRKIPITALKNTEGSEKVESKCLLICVVKEFQLNSY